MPEFRPFLMERLQFGMDHYLRIRYGLPHEYLLPALDRIHELIVALSE